MSINVNLHAVGERFAIDGKTLDKTGNHVITIRASEMQTVAVFFDGRYVKRANIDAIVDAFNAAYSNNSVDEVSE